MRFLHKSTFVTGAGSGIGRATSLRLASEGAALLCFDRNAQTAEETAVLIRQRGGNAIASEGDVRDRKSIERAVALALDSFGSLSYLVNNAGLVRMSGFEELAEEEWDFVMDVNLKGQFLTAQVVAPAIAASAGVVDDFIRKTQTRQHSASPVKQRTLTRREEEGSVTSSDDAEKEMDSARRHKKRGGSSRNKPQEAPAAPRTHLMYRADEESTTPGVQEHEERTADA